MTLKDPNPPKKYVERMQDRAHISSCGERTKIITQIHGSHLGFIDHSEEQFFLYTLHALQHGAGKISMSISSAPRRLVMTVANMSPSLYGGKGGMT